MVLFSEGKLGKFLFAIRQGWRKTRTFLSYFSLWLKSAERGFSPISVCPVQAWDKSTCYFCDMPVVLFLLFMKRWRWLSLQAAHSLWDRHPPGITGELIPSFSPCYWVLGLLYCRCWEMLGLRWGKTQTATKTVLRSAYSRKWECEPETSTGYLAEGVGGGDCKTALLLHWAHTPWSQKRLPRHGKSWGGSRVPCLLLVWIPLF